MSRLVVMSLRPQFARAIYSKAKKFEFRRVRVRLEEGDRVLVYECAPVSHLTGEFRVGEVISGSVSQLVVLETEKSNKAAAKRYLRGAKIATAIEIINAVRWKQTRPLVEFLGGRRPPQSYMFIEG